jgi:hypothetical protein
MAKVTIDATLATTLRGFTCQAGDRLIVLDGLVLGVDQPAVVAAVAAPEEPQDGDPEAPKLASPPAEEVPPTKKPAAGRPQNRPRGRPRKAAGPGVGARNSEAAATELLTVLRAIGPGRPIKVKDLYRDAAITTTPFLRCRARQILEDRGLIRSEGKGFGMEVELLGKAAGVNGAGAAA